MKAETRKKVLAYGMVGIMVFVVFVAAASLFT
jgi:hypothetical protein